jgi:hypothetical protein
MTQCSQSELEFEGHSSRRVGAALNRLELGDGSPHRYQKITKDSLDTLLVAVFLESLETPEEIVLDLDTTDVELNGKQEGRFFHGYYDEYCYLPLDILFDLPAGYRIPATLTTSAAPEREAQGRTNLLHPLCAQVADAASQPRLGHGNRVVQIDSATALHSVVAIQNHFGRHAANG